MNQTFRQTAGLKRVIGWKERRRGAESNAHRDVDWCRDIASDVTGGLILLPLAFAIVFLLAVLIGAIGCVP